MLRGFPSRIGALVVRLGRTAIYRTYTITGPSYDPVRTPMNTPITLVEFDFEAPERDGSIITTNDTEFVIDSAVPIDKTGLIVDRGIEYQIVSVDDTMIGNDAIMYVVQCRR